MDDDFYFTAVWQATCTYVPSLVEIGRAVLEIKWGMKQINLTEAKHNNAWSAWWHY
jgi:hypothetical protein